MENTKLKKSQSSVEVDNKDASTKELIEREEIKDSPFMMVTTNGESFGVMGDYRLTESGTKEEIRFQLREMSWNRIIQVIMILNEKKEEMNKEIEKLKN